MFEVLREQSPVVLACVNIVDEIRPPSVGRPQTSRVSRLENHTQSIVPNTVAGFDTSDCPLYPKLVTPHYRLLRGEGALLSVRQGGRLPRDLIVKQVELGGSAWTQATHIRRRTGMPCGELDMVPVTSNPASGWVGWFVCVERPAIPGFLPVCLVQEFGFNLRPLPVLLDFVAFPPGDARESVASGLGPGRHADVVDPVHLLVLLQTTSGGSFLGPQRRECT
jgi:hypothetical protein